MARYMQVRQLRPERVILWGWGVMNPTALKTARSSTGCRRSPRTARW